MIRTVLRLALILALALAPMGCNMWPWGGYSNYLTPGNQSAGQQTGMPRFGSSIEQSDFRTGSRNSGF